MSTELFSSIYIVAYSRSTNDLWSGTLQLMIEENQKKMSQEALGDFTPVFATTNVNEAIKMLEDYTADMMDSLKEEGIDVAELTGMTPLELLASMASTPSEE